MARTRTQLKSLELELKLLEEEKLTPENELKIRQIKEDIYFLTNKGRSLKLIDDYMRTFETKLKLEDIYGDTYFCFYFKNGQAQPVDSKSILIHKGLSKGVKITKLEWNDDLQKEIPITYHCPPVFFGYYINYKVCKLSIPAFLYDNDIDVMNFLDMTFQSKTREWTNKEK